jgi:hypothetical protein
VQILPVQKKQQGVRKLEKPLEPRHEYLKHTCMHPHALSLSHTLTHTQTHFLTIRHDRLQMELPVDSLVCILLPFALPTQGGGTLLLSEHQTALQRATAVLLPGMVTFVPAQPA